ncbi:MAG: protein kinase domain-containing protein [Victivallaceae bacterium]
MARILIADDSLVVRKSYESMLSFLGHEVISCKDGKDTLEAFRTKSPELLILDVQMPVMDGLEACREIRRMPAGATVPIIIVSALEEEDDILKGLNAGANDYLVKPVREAHLIAKLKTSLGISALHKQDFELAKKRTVFAGKYRIEKMLGYGSHSTVFLVTDTDSNNRQYALKLLKESFAAEDMVKSFIAEAEQIRKIDCEQILKIHDVGKFQDRLYLVLELAADGDLQKILKHRRLTELEASQLAYDIIRGIKALRNNKIVHLDIKPGNILLSGGHYKLADFGMVIPRKSATMPLNAEIWGTAGYISPEYLTSEQELTSKSDIYSLAITLYQAITGDNPFNSERASVSMFRQVNLTPPSLQDYDKNVSEYFSGAIQAMLEKDPAQRPSEEELEEVFSSLIEYNQCREEQVNSIPKEARSHEAVIAASNQLLVSEFDETTVESANSALAFTPAPQIKVKIETLEKRFDKMPLFKRQTKKIVKSLKRTDPRIIILSAALLIVSTAAGWAGYLVFSSSGVPITVKEGPMTAVICPKCNLSEERRIMDINTAKCSKCQGHLAIAQKCEKCKNIFALPEIPDADKMTPEEYTAAFEKTHRCPKCKSDEIIAVPLLKEEADDI